MDFLLPTMTNDKPDLLSEKAPHMHRPVTFKQGETSGYEPQSGLVTKTDTVNRNVTLTLSGMGCPVCPVILLMEFIIQLEVRSCLTYVQ
jgi:hypothetical protein